MKVSPCPPLPTSFLTLFALALVACGDQNDPEPDVDSFSLSCELNEVKPATIALGEATQIRVSAQCEVAPMDRAAAQLALDSATFQVGDAEVSDLSLALSSSGELIATAMVTASKLRALPFSIVDDTRTATERILGGVVHVHNSEADIIAEFGTPKPDECFVLCVDESATVKEEYFVGATCECASPTMTSFTEIPTEIYSWTDEGRLHLARLDRIEGESPVRTDLVIDLMTEPLPFSVSQTLITRNSVDAPTLLWWGLSSAGAIVGVQVPLLSDTFGEVNLSNSKIFNSRPAVFVSSMELRQSPNPNSAPTPVVLFAYMENDVDLAWSLVELFEGKSGAAFLTETPLWGEVSPLEVQSGVAQVGLTRDSSDLNPEHGVDFAANVRAWTIRPNPTTPTQMDVTTYLGGGAGLEVEYTGTLTTPNSAQCWQLSPAPGGHLISHSSLVAGGDGGLYYGSPSPENILGMAPVHNFDGTNLFIKSTTFSCPVQSPLAWTGLFSPGQGAFWVRPLGRRPTWASINRLRAEPLRKNKAYANPFYSVIVENVVPGGNDPIGTTHAIPIRAERGPGTPGLRTQTTLGSRHVSLTKALTTGDCTPESPCTSLLATTLAGWGVSLAFPGTSSPSLKLSLNGDVVRTEGWPDLQNFDDKIAPPMLIPTPGKPGLLSMIDLPSAGGLGLVSFNEDGSHGDFTPLDLPGEGQIVHASVTLDSTILVLRDQGNQLLVQQVNDISAGGTTTELGTLAMAFGAGSYRLIKLRAVQISRDSIRKGVLSFRGGTALSDVTLVLQEDGELPCRSFTALLPNNDTGDLMAACDEGWSAIATGTFLAVGGVQLLMSRISGQELLLELWVLTPTEIVSLDYATVPLLTLGTQVRISAGDLDNDGLSDVFIDADSSEGVLLGFSDGLGGTRQSIRAYLGLSPGFSPLPGAGPGIAATAHFGKGTKNSASSASAKPELL